MPTEVRLPQTPREQAYAAIAILALVGAGAYWNWVYNGKVVEHTILETRITTLDTLNQRAQTEIRQGTVEEIRAQTAVYEENLRSMFQLVPQANEVPELLESISNAARRAGLDIGPVDVLGVDAGRDFEAHRYRLSVTGPYHAVGEFLANVGSLRRIVSPLNITVNALAPAQGGGRGRAAGPAPTVAASFEVHTYVARNAPAPVPAQGGGE
jgi:type IV pilus assembly protein PilO